MEKIGIFISYHHSDRAVAETLESVLGNLSDRFEIFLDETSVDPGQDFELAISESIAKAQWFLIVCCGPAKAEKDMAWSFFEAGQFRAKLSNEGKSSKFPERISCLYDIQLPSPLARFHGTRVQSVDLNNRPLDLTANATTNLTLERTETFRLLERLLTRSEERPLRDTTSSTVRSMLREQTLRLINAFQDAQLESVVDEKPLQPRISFKMPPKGALLPTTEVEGWDDSLADLFGIQRKSATWQEIKVEAAKGLPYMPLWVRDIELAGAAIAQGLVPEKVDSKCRLGRSFYRVFPARYLDLKNGSKVCYVSFLPSSTRPFEFRQKMSTLVSGLVLSIRFRERVIPLVLRNKDPEDPRGSVMSVYREIVATEMEAAQFGLAVDQESFDDEAPLASAFRDGPPKVEVEKAIAEWTEDRKKIECIFTSLEKNEKTPNEAWSAIVSILQKLPEINARFILDIIAELKFVAKLEKSIEQGPVNAALIEKTG